MTTKDVCPICEEGHLTHFSDLENAEYKGVVKSIPLHYSRCDACGSEQANATDVRQNRRAMQAFKKEVEGLLSGKEITAIREQYDISQKQAANIFGGGPVAFSKYEADDVIQSESMDKLLRVCREHLSAFISLARRAKEDDLVNRLLNAQAETFVELLRPVKPFVRMESSFEMSVETKTVARCSVVTKLPKREAA